MTKEALNITTASPKELLERGILCQRYEELTCFDRILVEKDLVDLHRVAVLKSSMQGRRGQIDPVTYRVRLEKQKEVYDIINGYHRTPAIIALNTELHTLIPIKTTVLYGCNDEEMYDLRVIAADNVKSIKFPRMARWMTASFKSRKWDDPLIDTLIRNGDLTLSQVFALASQDSSGKNLGLIGNATDELKAWALHKSDIWGRPLGSLMQDMRTVDLAAPDLVQRVRLDGGTHGARGSLTQARLQAIVEQIPGDYELQRKFVDLAINHNIVATDLGDLVFAYHAYQEAGDSRSMRELLDTPEVFLHPKPRPGLLETQTIFDAQHSNRTEGHAIFVRPKEHKKKYEDHPADRESVHVSVSRMLIEMINQQAFTLNLSSAEKKSITFNIIKRTVMVEKHEVSLTMYEARMLFVLLALKRHSGKRITGRGMMTWFFPGEMQHDPQAWRGIFDSLKMKLDQASPDLTGKLAVHNEKSLYWSDSKTKTPLA